MLKQKLKNDEYKGHIDDYVKRKNNDEKISIRANNIKFLKDKELELGQLYCEYCEKGPLRIYSFNVERLLKDKKFDIFNSKRNFNEKDGATCDHKVPKSKGGEKFDYSNLAVCYYSCNQEKYNMSWERCKEIKNL